MNWRLRLYSLSRRRRKFRGYWRVRSLMNLLADREFVVPYLTGRAAVNPRHAMGRDVFEKGVYEPEVIELIQTMAPDAATFVDVWREYRSSYDRSRSRK